MGQPTVTQAKGAPRGVLAPELSGVILFCERYEACVAFYATVLELPLWFKKPELTCFRFGGAYLMLEHGGTAARDGESKKSRGESPTVLRLNVADIDAAISAVRGRGLTVERMSFEWGVIASVADPDGNLVELCQWPDPALVQSFGSGH